MPSTRVRFGPFQLDLRTAELRKHDLRVRLHDQPFRILTMLLDRPGEVVLRDEIRLALWPDDTVVAFDQGINAAVKRLRAALGDSADKPRYIETLPRRGYRFIGVVESCEPEAAANATETRAGTPPDHATNGYGSTEEMSLETKAPLPTPAPRNSLARTRIAWSLAVAGVLTAAGAIWIWSGRSSQQPRLVPLTGANGEGFSAFSPAGDRLAYMWNPEDGSPRGIYVKTIGAGDPVPVAVGKDQAQPAWSPDGQFIAYFRMPPGLYAVPALGGPERKITDLRDTEIRGRRVSWSPDGKHIAIVDLDPGTGLQAIFEVSLETGERRVLTSGAARGDSNPAYSPDGNSLGFVRRSAAGASAVYIIPAAGGEPRRLTGFDERAFSFDWTTDGSEIVYSAFSGSSSPTLWRVAISGGRPRRIVEAGSDVDSSVVARSANRTAFNIFRRTINLWRTDFDQPSHPRKVAPTYRWQSSPEYAPDGRRLAFVSNRSGRDEIWTSDTEGRGLTQLTSLGPESVFAGTPRWSPDGLEIVFVAGLEGTAQIHVISTQGGAPRRITSERAENILPIFSRDGRYIFFTSNRGGTFQLWRMDRSGANAAQVTRNGGVAGRESADGNYLYYMNYNRSNELWRVPVGGGAEEKVFEGPSFWKGTRWRTFLGWWTVAAAGIVYIDHDSSGPQPAWQIKAFDPATRGISTLTPIAGQPELIHPCLTISPDGRGAVYSQAEGETRTIMLLENFR